MAEKTLDQLFVEFVARNLVDNEDAVKVERIVDERGVLLTLFVAPEDLGRVIGKRGSIAESIRTLLRSLGMKHGAHYNLKIADTDGGTGKRVSEEAPVMEPIEAKEEEHVEEDSFGLGSSDIQPEKEAVAEVEEQESDFVKNTREELADLDS
jgi:predicted RNA-binding protein YlqC (UPF0109 family)